MSNNIEKTKGFIHMDSRIWPEFRQQVYNYLKDTLSNVMTDEDLDVIIKLIAEIFGDLYMRAKVLP